MYIVFKYYFTKDDSVANSWFNSVHINQFLIFHPYAKQNQVADIFLFNNTIL
jgi:hypothetical protein